MTLRKIGDDVKPRNCVHPEHNPPTMILREPGTYEHTCPGCGEACVLVVRSARRSSTMSQENDERNAAQRNWQGYQIPELPYAEAHRRAIERVRNMTPRQILASSVRVGIHKPDGTLADEYYRDAAGRLDFSAPARPLPPEPAAQFKESGEQHRVSLSCSTCNSLHTISATTVEGFIDARNAKTGFAGDQGELHELTVGCRFCGVEIVIRARTVAAFVVIRTQLLKAHERCGSSR